MNKLVQEWLEAKLSPDIIQLIALANHDLYNGATSNPEYPGFTIATDKIRKALEEVGDLWIDTDCDIIYESEPEDGEIRHMSRREVISCVTGKTLALNVL